MPSHQSPINFFQKKKRRAFFFEKLLIKKTEFGGTGRLRIAAGDRVLLFFFPLRGGWNLSPLISTWLEMRSERRASFSLPERKKNYVRIWACPSRFGRRIGRSLLGLNVVQPTSKGHVHGNSAPSPRRRDFKPLASAFGGVPLICASVLMVEPGSKWQ